MFSLITARGEWHRIITPLTARRIPENPDHTSGFLHEGVQRLQKCRKGDINILLPRISPTPLP